MSEWRVGGKVPLNVYEGDTPMFQCHTPEQAARVVQLLNAAPLLETQNAALRAALERTNKAIEMLWGGTPIGWRDLHDAIQAALASPAAKEKENAEK